MVFFHLEFVIMGKKAPQRAKRPCLVSSCKEYATNQGYCDNHQEKIRKKDRERGTAHQRGYDARWEKERLVHLAEQPLCADHQKRGYVVVATVVDHITPHKGDKKLFWDKTNWQSLCKPCHDRKTQLEDRGSWSPQTKPIKKEVELHGRVNPFFDGDIAMTCTGYAVELLSCKLGDSFTVLSVSGKLITIEDEDGFVHHLHYSHFNKQV